MTAAFIWALIAASSLVLGGLLASWVPMGKRTVGSIMGFGAGVLLSAVAYELVFEAVNDAKMTGIPALGLFTGAFVFLFSDMLIGKMSGGEGQSGGGPRSSSLVVPLVLAIILDGIPESVVIGLGILEGGSVSLAMLIAVFISNVPEAVASSTGMRASGWSQTKILVLWVSIAVVCGAASALGYALLEGVSPVTLSFVLTFSGGAILMMLANAMIPEAYEHAGRLAGVFTVIGFATSVLIIVLERSGVA